MSRTYTVCGDADGDGLLHSDPRFVAADALDFTLDAFSPCIDAGDPGNAYDDSDGTRNDMGIYGATSGLRPPKEEVLPSWAGSGARPSVDIAEHEGGQEGERVNPRDAGARHLTGRRSGPRTFRLHLRAHVRGARARLQDQGVFLERGSLTPEFGAQLRDTQPLMIFGVVFMAGVLACSGPADDGGKQPTDSEDTTSAAHETGSGTDTDVTLTGCQDPANWDCSGADYGCVAVCDHQEITCNQNYDICRMNNGDECDVPTDVSGCDICEEAILSQCASVITP